MSHSIHDIVAVKDRYRNEQAARLIALVRPVAPNIDEAPDAVLYRCAGYDQTASRCLVHDERPQMCRDYPGNMDRPCRWCSAATDQEARGVALQVCA